MTGKLMIRKISDMAELRHGFDAVDHAYSPPLSMTLENYEDYLNKLFTHAEVYFACFEEEVAGLIAFYANDESRIAYISQIAVVPSVQKKGVGQCLMDYCVNYCQAAGFIEVRLEVRKNNHRAIEFYLKNGFSEMEDKNNQSFYMMKNIECKV